MTNCFEYPCVQLYVFIFFGELSGRFPGEWRENHCLSDSFSDFSNDNNKFQMIEINDTCAEDPPQADAFRMILIVIIGTVVCSLGIVLNTFLLLSLRRLDVFRSNILYLFLLACLDILVELCFMVSHFQIVVTNQNNSINRWFLIVSTCFLTFRWKKMFWKCFLCWHDWLNLD